MSQLRQDPISLRWVVIATGRAGRPNEYRTVPQRRSDRNCPFCLGQEQETPHQLFAVDRHFAATENGEWQVRVVPNKYPALFPEAPLNAAGAGTPFTALPAVGHQEVVIESPRHLASTGQLSADDAGLVMRVYRERFREHRAAGQAACGLVFKNVGPAAGASLEHTHSQIAILPIVPDPIQSQLARGRESAARGEHLWLSVLNEELTAAERIVAETEHLVAFCPFAPRFPYETWIFPRAAEPRFEDSPDAVANELGALVRNLVLRLEKLLDRPAYNYILHTAPFAADATGYLWHLELFPRTAMAAGFEWGLGWHINPTSPESAAAALRAV